MCKILRQWLIGPHKRFRLTKFQTRFGTVEWFAFDAADITDSEVREGKYLEPFAQGEFGLVCAAIRARQEASCT